MIDDGVGELSDYNLTIEEAEQMQVCWGGASKMHTLGSIGRKSPHILDRLLDEHEPGNLLFHAIVLVNEKYAKEVAEAVNTRNQRIKKLVRSQVNRQFILPSLLHCSHLFGDGDGR